MWIYLDTRYTSATYVILLFYRILIATCCWVGLWMADLTLPNVPYPIVLPKSIHLYLSDNLQIISVLCLGFLFSFWFNYNDNDIFNLSNVRIIWVLHQSSIIVLFHITENIFIGLGISLVCQHVQIRRFRFLYFFILWHSCLYESNLLRWRLIYHDILLFWINYENIFLFWKFWKLFYLLAIWFTFFAKR